MFVFVQIFAHVKKFSVSCMRDFCMVTIIFRGYSDLCIMMTIMDLELVL